MSDERRKMLDEIGFVWNVGIPIPKNHWKHMFEKLVAYKEKWRLSSSYKLQRRGPDIPWQMDCKTACN